MTTTSKKHKCNVIYKGASKFRSGICIGINHEAWEGNLEDIVRFCFMRPFDQDNPQEEGGSETYENACTMMMTPMEAILIGNKLVEAGLSSNNNRNGGDETSSPKSALTNNGGKKDE